MAVRKFGTEFPFKSKSSISSAPLCNANRHPRAGPLRTGVSFDGRSKARSAGRMLGALSPFANLTRRKSTIALTFRGKKARLG
jgi:hypothetical protein